MPQRFQQFYGPQEVAELQRIHRAICEARAIDPASDDGHELAGAIISAVDGGQRDEQALMARFCPPKSDPSSERT